MAKFSYCLREALVTTILVFISSIPWTLLLYFAPTLNNTFLETILTFVSIFLIVLFGLAIVIDNILFNVEKMLAPKKSEQAQEDMQSR